MIQLTGTVRDGKIELVAPRELTDGATVSLLLLSSTLPDAEGMDDKELARTLAALNAFEQAFPENEEGEDLSEAARETSDWEKTQVGERANRIESRFE